MATYAEGRVDEDTVCYRLFTDIPREQDVTEYLEYQRDIFVAFTGHFCMNYIWQQDPFNLRLHTATTSKWLSCPCVKFQHKVAFLLCVKFHKGQISLFSESDVDFMIWFLCTNNVHFWYFLYIFFFHVVFLFVYLVVRIS